MFDNLMVKFQNYIVEELKLWVESFAKMIPNIILAVLVLIIFYFLAKFVRFYFEKLVRRVSDNPAIVYLFTKIVFSLIFLFGLFLALSILELEKAVTSLLAGAGVIGIALGFAFQEIASNFVSGILISFQRPYKVGDIIEINGFRGAVKQIELRVTVVRTFDGLEVLIPNKTMYTSALINYTSTPDRRIDIQVGVSYGENLPRVTEIVKAALRNVEGKTNKDIEVFFHSFADSSINFVVQVWIDYPGVNYYWKAHHQIITKIKEAFDANDIVIPFPIRTIDFGIKGGTRLNQELAGFNFAKIDK